MGRARVIAIFILAYSGNLGIRDCCLSPVAERAGIGIALVSAVIGTIATTLLVVFAKLRESTADLSPSNH